MMRLDFAAPIPYDHHMTNPNALPITRPDAIAFLESLIAYINLDRIDQSDDDAIDAATCLIEYIDHEMHPDDFTA